MIEAPFLIFYFGAIVVALSSAFWMRYVVVATTLLASLNMYFLYGKSGDFFLINNALVSSFLHFDQLSHLFGILFHLGAVICAIYSWHTKSKLQQVVALLYPGSAIGIVFAGDFLTFLVFWEMLMLSSLCFLLVRGNSRSLGSAIRYLLFQGLSGVLLFIGVIYLFYDGDGLTVRALSISDPGAMWVFFAFGIKAAFPMLHTWLIDSYAEADEAGAVFLSTFTTKVAIYALARVFYGFDALIFIGVVMACFPIFYAVIENDLRRVLSYSLINQLGFMVCGIGIGTELALNGAVAHAFTDVLFKGLLMMSMGAVLYRTGEMRASELGGLFKSMPKTTFLCIVGAASISAFPLFSGFVSKSMIMVALLNQNLDLAWYALLFASAGVFHHAGIKIPFFAFFAHDSGLRPKEAPTHMLIAMGFSAFLCILIGIFPNLLYQLLPYQVSFSPFDIPHVLAQLQLLFFSALAFVFLQLTMIYPPELKSVNLDTDWFYRKLGKRVFSKIEGWALLCKQYVIASNIKKNVIRLSSYCNIFLMKQNYREPIHNSLQIILIFGLILWCWLYFSVVT